MWLGSYDAVNLQCMLCPVNVKHVSSPGRLISSLHAEKGLSISPGLNLL